MIGIERCDKDAPEAAVGLSYFANGQMRDENPFTAKKASLRSFADYISVRNRDFGRFRAIGAMRNKGSAR
jgi:hypothetical protein